MNKPLSDIFGQADEQGLRIVLGDLSLDGKRFAYGQKVKLDDSIEADIAAGAIADGYDKEGMFIVTRLMK